MAHTASHKKNVYGILAVAVLVAAESVQCEDIDSPFVAAFDRFARHGDIELVVGGRLLLSELSCTACHATKLAALNPKLGPRLDGAGDRIQRDWIKRFLASPHSLKPGTTMPDVLAAFTQADKEQAIEALIAFLSTQHSPFPEIKATGLKPVPHEFWKKGRSDHGQQLYHQIGCVACHQPDAKYEGGSQSDSALDKLLEQLDPDEIKEMGLTSAARPVRSIPHGDLITKYTRKSLTHFLLDPAAIRPGGRMPNFKLQPVEAADLAAYLLRDAREPNHDTPLVEESLVEKGRQLFGELQCVNCHVAKELKPMRNAKPLAELDFHAKNKCFGEAQRGVPNYKLDGQQTESVGIALTALSNPSAKSQVEFTMLQLNCYACHDRDQRGGVGRKRQKYLEVVGHVDLGDEGRLPPPLTGVGRKLHSSWTSKVLAGTGDVRPYMTARMPIFAPTSVATLSSLFAEVDGQKQPSESDVFGDVKRLAEAGRALMDTGCVQCHPVRGESLSSVVGIDLAGIPSRIHPDWFRQFLFDPAQLKDRTRMPTFFPKGKSANQDVLDGNVDRQIAAMWAYLKDIDKQPLPEKIVEAKSNNYELIPTDRPILLRTFMDHVGTHAIAVGFPQKVHFAFDAENMRLTEAWRGRFLDAYGTWFMRFTPPADPLGSDLIALPAGVPLALLVNKQQQWPSDTAEELGYQFAGYRFDRAGVPTFLYRFDRYNIEDRIEPNDDHGLKRRLHLNDRSSDQEKAATLWFRVDVAKKLDRKKENSYTNERGMTTTVAGDWLGRMRESDESVEWLIPIRVDGEITIDLEYQWIR